MLLAVGITSKQINVYYLIRRYGLSHDTFDLTILVEFQTAKDNTP